MKQILYFFGLIFLSTFLIFNTACDVVNTSSDKDNELIGGQRDKHGCLTPAGYAWDEDVGACLRDWELDEGQKKASKIIAQSLDYDITIVDIDVARCVGCFIVHYERNDNNEKNTISLNNWQLSSAETVPSENKITNFEECIADGNVAMESYPRQCSVNGKTFVEQISHTCTQEEKDKMACTREYIPVCGDDGNTYGNKCSACSSGNIDSWDMGACTKVSLEMQARCEDQGGNWIEEADECEHIAQSACDALGGTFNECASACRNDPEAEICTMQCVLVCEFN